MIKLIKNVPTLNKTSKKAFNTNKMSPLYATYMRLMAIILLLTIFVSMVACTVPPKDASSLPQPTPLATQAPTPIPSPGVDLTPQADKVYGTGTVYNFERCGFFYIDDVTRKWLQLPMKCDVEYRYINYFGKGKIYSDEEGGGYKMVYAFPSDNRDGLNFVVTDTKKEGLQIYNVKTPGTSPYIIKGVSLIDSRVYIVFEDMQANSYFAVTSLYYLKDKKPLTKLTYISDVKTIYNDFVMVDNQTGFLTATLDKQVAYPVIYRTTDGGETWKIVSQNIDMSQCKIKHEYYTHDTYSSFAHAITAKDGRVSVLISFDASGNSDLVKFRRDEKEMYEIINSPDNGETWLTSNVYVESDINIFSYETVNMLGKLEASYDNTKPLARDNLPIRYNDLSVNKIVHSPQTHYNYDIDANQLKYRQQVYQQFGISSTYNNDIDSAIRRLWRLGVGMYNHGGSFVSEKSEMVKNPNSPWGVEYRFFIDFDTASLAIFTKAGREQLLQQRYFSMDEDSLLYIDKISGMWGVQSCRHTGWGGSVKLSRYEILSQTENTVQVRVYCKSYDFNGDYTGEFPTDFTIAMEDGVWQFAYISDSKL